MNYSQNTQPSGYGGKKNNNGFFKVLGKVLAIVLETVLMIAVALLGVMYVFCKGPSPEARKLFVMSVRETSAIGFLANIYLSDEEIAEIESGKDADEYVETDTTLINIPAPQEISSGETAKNDYGLVDEDGDGLILEEINGQGYRGFMMVVLDPSRVVMGCVPSSFGYRGYTVAEMVDYYDAVVGINAGGFLDPNGQGNGSEPDTLVVSNGEIYYSQFGTGAGFVGFDDKYILHTGKMSIQQIKDANIQYGVCFGPTLVSNGEANDPDVLASGLNPRTAIGQREDGAVLLLVIDGRQVNSAGATYQDLADIMLRYGAVNACNLDGGSSTLMWYEGDYINNCASVIGIRPVPSTFLVLKEGKSNG